MDHIWIRSVDLLKPTKQATPNMCQQALQVEGSPESVRLCVCSARRSIGRILASFFHAQTGLHLQQLGLHARHETNFMQQSQKRWNYVQKTGFKP